MSRVGRDEPESLPQGSPESSIESDANSTPAAAPEQPTAAIAARFGHHFANPQLLERALTHRSFTNESTPAPLDNERLEFLGDAVVDLVATDLLMQRLPDAEEGVLSQARAQVVSEVALARVAERIGLGAGLRLGRGEDQTGGRSKPSLLCDALEAVIGAIYLDAGFEAAHQAAAQLLAPLVDEAATGVFSDSKTRLQEWTQARLGQPPRYAVVAEEGPDHAKTFEVTVGVSGQELARGRGRSKKEAEQRAAELGLRTLIAQDTPKASQ